MSNEYCRCDCSLQKVKRCYDIFNCHIACHMLLLLSLVHPRSYFCCSAYFHRAFIVLSSLVCWMAKFKGKTDGTVLGMVMWIACFHHGEVSRVECGRLSSERESKDLLAEASVREWCRIYCCYPFRIWNGTQKSGAAPEYYEEGLERFRLIRNVWADESHFFYYLDLNE